MYTVAIVDDEAIVRHGIRHAVDWNELNVSRVEEAFHGMEVIDRWDEWKPDLIITDIRMPAMDGIELIRRAKERSPRCKFIVLSCINEFEYVKEALLLGASDYMLKMTVRPDEMTACIRRVVQEMEERRRQERLPFTGRPSDEPYKIKSIVRDILTYKYTAPQIVEAAQICAVESVFRRYALVVMEVNLREALYRFGSDGKRLVSFCIVNMLSEIAMEEGDFDWIKMENDEYVIVFDRGEGADDEDLFVRRVESRLKRIAEDARRHLKIESRFGVSRTAESIEKLTSAYREAKNAVERCLFRPAGEPVVFASGSGFERDAGADAGMPGRFAASFRKRMEAALVNAREDEAIEAIDSHFAQLAEGACSAEIARRCMAKAAAVVHLLASEEESHERPPGEGGMEPAAGALDESAFDAGWNVERTRERLKSFCRDYLNDLRTRHETGGRKLTRDIVAYLNEHYADKISLEQTARTFYVNKTYLSELFKAETGSNFTRYLNEVRVDRAKRLILQSGMTITDISERVGFSDFRYFSRVFKQHTDLAPSEFKARFLQGGSSGV